MPISKYIYTVLLSRHFSGLETKTETLVIRSRDRDMDKMYSVHSSLKTMVSRSQHCIYKREYQEHVGVHVQWLWRWTSIE